MEKILFILPYILMYLNNTSSLIDDIKSHYDVLDSKSYCNYLFDIYKQTQYNNLHTIMYGTDTEIVRKFCFGYDDADSITIHNAAMELRNSRFADSIYYNTNIDKFTEYLQRPNPYFVLKLNVIDGKVYADTSKLNFDLYWVDNSGGASIVIEQDDINFYTHFFPSEISSKKIKKAMNKVLKEKPYCLLSCNDIFGLIYVLDDEIYVYCLKDMRKYELNYYMQYKFAENYKKLE